MLDSDLQCVSSHSNAINYDHDIISHSSSICMDTYQIPPEVVKGFIQLMETNIQLEDVYNINILSTKSLNEELYKCAYGARMHQELLSKFNYVFKITHNIITYNVTKINYKIKLIIKLCHIFSTYILGNIPVAPLNFPSNHSSLTIYTTNNTCNNI